MPQILIVSGDLLATSQLGGLCRSVGGTAVIRPSLQGPPPEPAPDLVLLDLQWLGGEVDQILSEARAMLGSMAADRPVRFVAFGPHVWRERLDAALAAGAEAAVSRGELLGAFPTLFQRWTAG